MLDTQINAFYRTSEDIDQCSADTSQWELIPLNEFLHYCATGTLPEKHKHNNELNIAHYRDRFIRAGINELMHATQQSGWVQFNLMTDGYTSPKLYSQLSDFFSELLCNGTAENAFFMHKSPGLRIRLQATQPFNTKKLKQIMLSQAQHWQNQRLITEYQHAIYEPEVTFFGGPVSMSWIHALFTADSLYWLKVHAQKTDNTSAIYLLKLSLVLLRHLFLALQIVDWEDLDVWNKVSEKTGRSLPMEDSLESNILKDVQAAILYIWNEPLAVLSQLADEERSAIQMLIDRFNDLCSKWRENYFQTEHACIGPRSAAAAYLIFFWNRANINFEQQRIATYALKHRNVLS